MYKMKKEEFIMSKFIITVYLTDGEVWETIRHTLEGMNNFCKDLFSDEKVVRYTVEEVSI
tara:strand:- start:8018 stop:8197 length:180 start_codon:yes stop_codon:yes gene_type:complete